MVACRSEATGTWQFFAMKVGMIRPQISLQQLGVNPSNGMRENVNQKLRVRSRIYGYNRLYRTILYILYPMYPYVQYTMHDMA